MAASASFAQGNDNLLPDFVTSQLGGSSGLVSTGIGYNLFGSKARVSGHYGVVLQKPGSLMSILSTKIFYQPVSLTVWNRLKLNPCDIGVAGIFNTASKVIREASEVRYPDEAWWKNRWQLELALQPSFTYEFPKDCFFHSMTGFFEFNINQAYITQSLRDDTSLQLRNTVKLGMGTRIVF
jgi:hypothetical protein